MRPTKRARHALGVALWLATGGCTRLDRFLFAPTPAASDADLFAAATQIPASLKRELKHEIITDDGVTVSAWALLHATPNDGDTTPPARHQTAILYCHGNNQNLSRFALRAQALWNLGYTVLAFDYRGYGKTAGTPSEQGTYKDGRAARRFITEAQGLGFDPGRVALYGYSLGAAVCSQLAVEVPTPALVLEAPFASIARLVGDDSGLDLPQVGFTRSRYDTEGKIAAHKGSLLVLHGLHDDYLRVGYGRLVHRAAVGARPNVLVEVPGADHETVPCAIKNERSPVPGACLGGYDPAYLRHVADTIDQAIMPRGGDAQAAGG
jgi:pimeloyl-ACP methyl ester carboxylesterase